MGWMNTSTVSYSQDLCSAVPGTFLASAVIHIHISIKMIEQPDAS